MRRIAVVLALLTAAPAQAYDISGTVSPETVLHGRDARVTWRITVRAHAEPARFSLRLATASRSPDQHGSTGFQPSRLREDEIHLEGPGTISGGQRLIVDHCSAFFPSLPTYGHPPRHGFDIDGYFYDVEVPAASEAVVVVPAQTSPDAPWPGTQYALSAQAGDTAIDLPSATAAAPFGVPLSISTDPPSTGEICGKRPRIEGGRPVRISGRTDPAIAGDRIDLVEVVAEGTRPIGAATVNPDGWFVLDGYVPAPGDHTIAARYASQRADRAGDRSPPLWFTADDPPPVPPPVEPPAQRPSVTFAGRPRVRGHTVTVPLRCHSETDACGGVVRLRRSGRRVVARRFLLAPTAVERVVARLPRPLGRTLRRRGRLRVQLEIHPDGHPPARLAVTLRRR